MLAFEAATVNMNLALFSGYPLLVFFAQKAGKKKLAVSIRANGIISPFINFSHQVD